MLVQFSVRNYKTFKDKATLSMVATSDNTLETDNVIDIPKFNIRLLKSAVIYGANASGKSKLLEAMNFMKDFTVNSSKKGQVGDKIGVDPFRLNTSSENDSSEFEIIFIRNNEMFRYGFEATQDKIVAEWLYHKPKTKEVEIFYRDEQKFTTHKTKFTQGNMVVQGNLVRNNALLLSVAAQFNDELASIVINELECIGLCRQTDLDLQASYNLTIRLAKNGFQDTIIKLLQDADTSIRDFTIEHFEKHKITYDENLSQKDILLSASKLTKTIHSKYNNSGDLVGIEEFDIEKDESSGTYKYFSLLGYIISWLNNGKLLIIDELDAKLHPNLVCCIIALFNSKETNPNNAQLIFNTHDTNLLGTKLFRRDQIWFTEKDHYEAAHLYSLADIKVRKDENWEENYIRGKYGAVPYLGDFGKLFNQ